ncbi:MAG: TadE/TadG family type IV pilus assembly protein [Methyloceanibacter sp.]
MFRASGRSLRSFAQDAKGNVAILFGVALIPILLSVGVAVDYGRALVVRERMADAADAAGLAIGSWPGLTQDELKTKAQQFFSANYPPDSIGTVGTLDVAFAGEDIKVSVSGEVPTTFMKLANFDTIGVSVTNTISKKERNIELVLVLDTTGSMRSGGKLSAMQSAAKKMVQTLFDGKSTSNTLKIAVVPFSAAVNIGAGNDDHGWLDDATYPNNSAIAKEDFAFSNGQSVKKLYDQITNRDWRGCVRERGGSYELTDDPPGSSAASKWVRYFAPDEPDTSSSYCNNYANDKTTGSADKRQKYTPKYNNLTVQGGNACEGPKGPEFNCPPRPITPLTNNQGQVISAIEELQANGYTVIPAGLLWGWRAISPGEPFTEGKPYDDEKWVNAIVLLTDGENEVRGGSNGSNNNSIYNAFGYAKNGHLGSTSGSNAEATLDSKTLAVCSAIKKVSGSAGGEEEIRLYTIGFQVTTASQNLLKSCASTDEQGSKLFYNSPTNEQLAGIFQDIAQGLGELRIAQ